MISKKELKVNNWQINIIWYKIIFYALNPTLSFNKDNLSLIYHYMWLYYLKVKTFQ